MNGAGSTPPDSEQPDISLLRPYLLASGRSEPIDNTLEVEAQVLTNYFDPEAYRGLTFERRDIVFLCRQTKSVAEIAAILGLHIGVARVLVADLADLGYVAVHRPNAQLSQDLYIIERVIRGLEAIR